MPTSRRIVLVIASRYENSITCYAYLEDVKSNDPRFVFENSRWFTRGWTLQELLAPPDVLFFDHDWTEIGTRASFGGIIEFMTGIPMQVLKKKTSWREYCVAQRMS